MNTDEDPGLLPRLCQPVAVPRGSEFLYDKSVRDDSGVEGCGSVRRYCAQTTEYRPDTCPAAAEQ